MPLSRRTRILAGALLAAIQLGATAARALPMRGHHMHGNGHAHGVQQATVMALTTPPTPAPCCPDCNGSIPCPANSGHVCITHIGCATTPALPFRSAGAGSPGTGLGLASQATWAAITSAIPPEPPPPRA